MRIHALIAAAAGLALVPASASAQAGPEAEESVLDGDYLTVGIGGAYGPSYEGSDDYVFFPVPVVQGRLFGVAITPRPGGVALDLIPDGEDARMGFSFGPVVTTSGNRDNQIKDPVVRSAGKLKRSIEVGGNAGVSFYRVLNPFDAVTLSADVKWDINGAHDGMTVSPGVGYFTPLSRAAVATLTISAKYVDDHYADYYYSVSPAQAAASGLPQFKADSGFASVGGFLLVGYDLNGNLLDGGPALFAAAGYSRLVGDARRNPYTAQRGSPNQFLVGAGLAYTF